MKYVIPNYWKKVVSMHKKCELIQCLRPRARRRKAMPGEVCSDEAVTEPEVLFRTNLFYTVYDTCLSQMNLGSDTNRIRYPYTKLLMYCRSEKALYFSPFLHFGDGDAEKTLKNRLLSTVQMLIQCNSS